MFGRAVALVVALVAVATGASAQQLRGTVRDSASGVPIPGAVITLLDGAQAIAARTTTNERGEFRAVLIGTGVRRVRVVRLGFRPAGAPLPEPRDGVIEIDVTMNPIPMGLQSVDVSGSPTCPRRRDRAQALSILEQARAGLLAMVVARSEKPARMMRLRAIREFDGSSGRILRQRVRIDSAGTAFGSFGAARSAEDFVTKGFAGDSAGTQVYFGPDAEVLLNDGFAAGYCFHVMNPDRSRRNQVGLGFLPADARVGRVDVDGALWIDTVARALVDIEFRYLNLDPRLAVFVPGGRIAFRGMPNGVVVIDRWSIRVYDMEVSGELARAEWPDGVTWQGRLGTLHLRALHGDGTPAAGTRVRLIGTDYTGIVDSVGSVEITDLIPGPYTASLVEPQLAEIGIANSGGYGFMAARATTNLARVAVLPAQEYVDQRCGAATVGIGETIGTSTSSAALLGRVTSSVDGKPVANARWTLRYQDALGDRRIIRDAEVGSDGVFQYCLLRRGASVVLDFRAKGMANATVSVAMTKQPTVVNVTMRPRP